MQRDDPTVAQYFRDQLDPVSVDKRGIVIPRSSLRRKVILLDTLLNEQQFRVEGDFVYFDQNSTGVATVKLNNTSEDPWPAVALAGVTDVPYTDIFVSAAAQAGKFLNMWYGYRARFMNPQQSIATIGSITSPVGVQGPRAYNNAPQLADLPVLNRDVGFVYGTAISTTSAGAANTAVQLIAPGTNVNGVILWRASVAGRGVTPPLLMGILAKSSAPATVIDGDVLVGTDASAETAGPVSFCFGRLERAVFVSAGKGIYKMNSQAEANAYASILATVL
jgi:hypothetical protein